MGFDRDAYATRIKSLRKKVDSPKNSLLKK